MDAHTPDQHMSVVHWGRFSVTQHPLCQIQIRVLNTTSCPSGEHKFKVVQVAISINIQAEWTSQTNSSLGE